MRSFPAILLAAALSASGAAADPSARESGATASIERHFTTDVFDGPVARSDAYTRATGSFRHFRGDAAAHVGVSGEASASRHDTYGIEDDFAAGLSVEAGGLVAERLELRGTLSASIAEEGDDLWLGDFVIGTRTRTRTLGAALQAGVDLGSGTSLALETTANSAVSGRTRFEDGLISPLKLEPDRLGLKAAVRLAHAVGDTTAALVASAGRTNVETIGWPPVSLGFDEAGVAVEIARVWGRGVRAALSLGLQRIAARRWDFAATRPVWHAELSGPVAAGLELRGALSAAFDTIDTDDPLGAYIVRGEVQLGYRPAGRVAFAVGAYAERRMNLLLENREHVAGGYGEATYAISPALALVMRADYRRSRATILDIRKRRLDTFVGLRAKM